MPISWKGTLQQYVGRLHRLHDNKRFVQVYDYVDDRVAMLARMYERRLRGYRAIGYTLEQSITDETADGVRDLPLTDKSIDGDLQQAALARLRRRYTHQA